MYKHYSSVRLILLHKTRWFNQLLGTLDGLVQETLHQTILLNCLDYATLNLLSVKLKIQI